MRLHGVTLTETGSRPAGCINIFPLFLVAFALLTPNIPLPYHCTRIDDDSFLLLAPPLASEGST